MTKGIVYYSQLNKDPVMTKICQDQLRLASNGAKIVSVTDVPSDFGDVNIVYDSKGGGYDEMFEKILLGIETLDTDVIYLAEDDVLYDPSHFAFEPTRKDVFYYNGNYWFLRMSDGFAVHYNVSPLSGLVAYREAMLAHFKERILYIKEFGFSRNIGFEPFTHHRIPWKNWFNFEIFNPERPNIDIALQNSTWKRWRIRDFRRKPTFWEESNFRNIPGWGKLPSLLEHYFGTEKLDLAILIPARNEMFLTKTIEDILQNIEADTKVYVGLDGKWADPPINDDPRVIILHYSESIGQRAMTNQLCRLTNAKYVMKVDAHCAFDKGFDRKMIEGMQGHDDWTMVPVMRNLHVFNWVCKNGHSRYQGQSGNCSVCGEPTERQMVWNPKTNPSSTSYCFDTEPHFQYFNEFKKRPEYIEQKKTGFTETMSLQGSCFMLTREKYWELNICDEAFGSWGSQGIEVAVKTWLSGGKVMCNHSTWYAHLFRTQGGDFGFPYELSGDQVSHAKKTARNLFINGRWGKSKHPLSWLLKKFWPVPGWDGESLSKLEGEK